MLFIISELSANVKSFCGFLPEIFVLTVEQLQKGFGVGVTVSREQSVDHKLTNALVLFLCSLGSSLESVIGDDVFLIFHALIIHNQDQGCKGYLGKLSVLSLVFARV